jgi:hypothetical protein
LDADEVIELLKRRCKEHGSIAAFAHWAALPRSLISETIHGKEKLTPAVCIALGLRRVVTYEPCTGPQPVVAPKPPFKIE